MSGGLSQKLCMCLAMLLFVLAAEEGFSPPCIYSVLASILPMMQWLCLFVLVISGTKECF